MIGDTFKQQIIDLHAKLADARIDKDEQRVGFLEKQIKLAVAALQAVVGGPMHEAPPFDDLKLTTDLDDPCILGRHRPPSTPPSA